MNWEKMLGRGLEITFAVIVIAWLLTRPQAFSIVVRSLTSGYVGAVGALMPRRV